MLLLLLAITAIIVVSYGYARAFHGAPGPEVIIGRDNQAVWGQYGDYIGGVLNPILGFLSFLALLLTLILQRQELYSAQQERDAAQQTLKKQTDVLNSQQSLALRQAFEATFFQLITFRNEAVRELDRSIRAGHSEQQHLTFSEAIVGQLTDQFKIKAKSLRDKLPPHKRDNESKEARDNRWETAQKEAWAAIKKEHSGKLAIFLRNISVILEFLDKSDFSDQRIYPQILHAQLPTFDRVLIMVHCAYADTSKGNSAGRWSYFIEKYGLLGGLAGGTAVRLRKYFSDNAFTVPSAHPNLK